MNQTFEDAIANKNLVEFWYGDHQRIAEPHVLGVSDGATQVLVFQVGGSSSSGALPEWRRFDLHKISQLSTLPEKFPGRRPFLSGKHSSWDYRIAVVE